MAYTSAASGLPGWAIIVIAVAGGVTALALVLSLIMIGACLYFKRR